MRDRVDADISIFSSASWSSWKDSLTFAFRTDIEQEQNGLYTWDRKEKLPADRMKEVLERAKEVYHRHRT